MTRPDNHGEVVAFPSHRVRPSYEKGVPPFDPTNPAHIRAWNTMFAFGQMSREWSSDT